jgi:rod shape-determining protein MreD
MRGWGTALVLASVALLLRSTALSALAGRGVLIDVLAFAVTAWSMRRGESAGTMFGFTLGLLADLDAAHWMGRHALSLSLIGYAAGRVSHTLVKDRARSSFALLIAAVAVHQVWTLAFEVGTWAGWPYILQRALLATLVTAPLGTLVLGIVRRVVGRPLFSHATVASGS